MIERKTKTCGVPSLVPCRFPRYQSIVNDLPLAWVRCLCGFPHHDLDLSLFMWSLELGPLNVSDNYLASYVDGGLGSGTRTYPKWINCFFPPLPLMGYHVQPWYIGKGLDPASTWYSRLCWLPKEVLTTLEERAREGERWGVGEGEGRETVVSW